ncbi:1,4-dihydroxy-6-naphthoate synthase [Rhodopirellula halodulae]|uniref:1,4-dihydroxy-6-naphthoate synthase n=1 Tax=Rhodopirellula halodulae TaxID=2894198 RepID=UPI001E5FA46C|nr:1,4-dihydroxy-6-naphthoate synthase [Rhodopirellula sp. JC737]MCC9656006.1 1,4-dihydroxy-6-naphthoate synthase [Rhodopirellula sp. JC737]
MNAIDSAPHELRIGEGPELHLGISTCPNDTFAFSRLLDAAAGNDQASFDTGGFTWRIELLDIDELNQRLLAGEFDLAKTSFHAALLMADETVVLPVGSALGFGVGPLLLAARGNTRPEDSQQITLCPGEHTTAHLLFRLFFPETTSVRQVIFSDIMPALQNESADFGVCIHEGRFTYQDSGLHLAADLGEMWEKETRRPLPLGGLVMRDRFDSSAMATACNVIRRSLESARQNPDSALPAMRRYAQEMDDNVLMKHVELYVNDWTVDLGELGRDALTTLSLRAQQVGLGTSKLRFFCGETGIHG